MTHDTGEFVYSSEPKSEENNGGRSTLEQGDGRGRGGENVNSESTDIRSKRMCLGTGAQKGSRPGVAVIDDEELVGEALARMIGAGARVDVFSNPRQFLKTLDKGANYDVVFCDLMMPKMTGMEVFETLEQRYAELASRVVIVTGGAISDQARDFLTNVDLPVLFKPVDRDDLWSFIGEFAPAEVS